MPHTCANNGARWFGVLAVADDIAVPYLGRMTAQVQANDVSLTDVVQLITGGTLIEKEGHVVVTDPHEAGGGQAADRNASPSWPPGRREGDSPGCAKSSLLPPQAMRSPRPPWRTSPAGWDAAPPTRSTSSTPRWSSSVRRWDRSLFGPDQHRHQRELALTGQERGQRPDVLGGQLGEGVLQGDQQGHCET
jgi:hypothetical protein